MTCSAMTCDCSTTTSSAGGVVSSLANVTIAVTELKPNAVDQCCPLCRAQPQAQPPQPHPHQQQHQHLHVQMPQFQAKCRHQELPNVTFVSHQRWIYQCHTCECLVTFDPPVPAVPAEWNLNVDFCCRTARRIVGRWNALRSTARTLTCQPAIVVPGVRTIRVIRPATLRPATALSRTLHLWAATTGVNTTPPVKNGLRVSMAAQHANARYELILVVDMCGTR